MHRRPQEYAVEYRENMKGGRGRVRFEHIWKKNSDDEMKSLCRQFSRLTLEPGASVGLHGHTGEEEIYYILSGHGRAWDDGAWVEVGPGDATICRSGEEHAMECTGPEPLVYLACVQVYPEKA